MQRIERITLVANTEQSVTFDSPGGKYLVKNFTNGDILFSINESIATKGEAHCFKIPAGDYEVCITNERMIENPLSFNREGCSCKTVYIKGDHSGEVEIQQLVW